MMIHKKTTRIKNKELSFIEEFLSSSFFSDIQSSKKYNVSILQEPFTGFGYPDLVCIIWDKKIQNEWSEKRNNLELLDIKILHHLYNVKRYKSKYDIIKELGFPIKRVEKSIENLFNANLININKYDKIKIRNLNKIFYIKEIISIEAKLRNWKKALEQSYNNTFFSSQSYVLFPEKIVTKTLMEEYKKTSIGIIAFEKSYKVIKKPEKNKIPASLTSWLFNEYIGRELCRTS